MINDDLQDRATLFAMGLLEGEELRSFEAAMHADAELRVFVESLSDTTAALARSLPPLTPPASVKAGVMAAITQKQVAPQQRPSSSAWLYVGWGIAAALMISGAVLWQERARLHSDLAALTAGEAEARAQNRELSLQLAEAKHRESTLAQLVAEATQKDGELNKALADAKAQSLQLTGQIATLRARNVLAEMQIATLQTNVDEYKQGVAVVVWDSDKQEGVLKLEKMPPVDPLKDYQLWVVDPKNPAPVSAGVVRVDAQGFAKVDFKPVDAVSEAAKFALSVETKGGVPAVKGPIVLIGP